MPSNQTPNYQLSQWSKGDQVKMEDFNSDNLKLDGAIAAEAGARAARDAALQTALNAKADVSALTAETARIDGELQRLEAVRQADLLAVYRWTPGATRMDIDLASFDLSRYVGLEARISRVTCAESTNISVLLNNRSSCYYEQSSSTTVQSSASNLLFHQTASGVYMAASQFSIYLDRPYITGRRNQTTSTASYTYLGEGKWGSKIRPEELTSINLVGRDKPITGGTVYLIGFKF